MLFRSGNRFLLARYTRQTCFASNSINGAKNQANIKRWILDNLYVARMNDLANAFVAARKQRMVFTNTDLISIYKMFEERDGDIQDYHVANIINGIRFSPSTHDDHIKRFMRYMLGKMNVAKPLPPRAIGTLMYGLCAVKLRHTLLTQMLQEVALHIRASSRPFPSVALCDIVYGLQSMNPRCAGVRDILRVLPSRIHNALTPYTPQSLANTLFALNNYTSYEREIRIILSALEPQFHLSDLPFLPRDIGCSLYGMRNMTDEHYEVRVILHALTEKVCKVKAKASSGTIASAFCGLRNMQGSPETMELLRQLNHHLCRCSDVMEPQHIAMIINGLRYIGAEDSIVHDTISALLPKIRECTKPFRAAEISGCFFGLQSMSSDHPIVLDLLGALNEKLAMCSVRFDAQAVANTLFGLRSMSNRHASVLDALRLLAPRIRDCLDSLEVRHVSASFNGLRSMQNSPEMDELLLALENKLHVSVLSEFDKTAVGSIYGGFKDMNSRSPVVLRVLGFLADKIMQGVPHGIGGQEVSQAFVGMRNMNKSHPEIQATYRLLNDLLHIATHVHMSDIRNILSSLGQASEDDVLLQHTMDHVTNRINNLSSTISSHDFCYSIEGLKSHRGSAIVDALLIALTSKAVLNDITFSDISRVVRGLRSMTSLENGAAIVLEKVNDSIVVDRASHPLNALRYLLEALILNTHKIPAASALHEKLIACVRSRSYSTEDIRDALAHVHLSTSHPRKVELLQIFDVLAAQVKDMEQPNNEKTAMSE